MTGPLAHGGRLTEAHRLFPDAPRPFLDLSTGINPCPYPIAAFDPVAFARLPEPEAIAALEARAAGAYGVADPAMVASAPGTQILIGLLPLLWPARNVAVLGPTYAEHTASWARGGASVREVADVAGAAGAETIVLCNPNNPDGRRIAPERLLALADGVRLLVVDEAFADFEPRLSVAVALPHPALIVLRSFGKPYGLAGVRLGFALAAPERIAAIRAALGPWAVSGPAVAIGSAALADRTWLAAAHDRLAADCARLDDLLRAAEMQVVGGTSLFRLAEAPEARQIFERLGRAGVFVRRFESRPHWLRFGLPGKAGAWERLSAALRPRVRAASSRLG